MNRKLVLAGVALLAGLIAFRLYVVWPTETEGGFQMPPGGFGRSVSAAEAEYGPVSEAVTLVGSLRAQEQVEVTPRVSGRVESVLVDLGDRVSAGDILAQIEDDELLQQLQQSEAALEVQLAVVQQRQLELRNQELILERARGLHESGLTSAEEMEQAQTRFDVAQSQVNLARAQQVQSEASYRELQIRHDQMSISAPMDGFIGRRFVDPGALVNSNTPVATIVNLATLELIAAVPERELAKVEQGAEGIVVVDALPGERFVGRVARISPLLDPQTRTAQVEVVVPNTDNRLRAEMFARVDLSLGSNRDALRVPREALVVRGQDEGVYVISEEVAHFTVVRTGLSEENWIEITEGLEAGDTVATMGANLLRDGDAVRVIGAPSAQDSEGATS
ncbi:MAG: efflux RND transporter periplasmic adaptor subunit [Acidobacteria bacterium]|nr:efflux RND transporter periplasmic adaptor subunit [Acidobacteriota bacterium]